MSKSISRGFLDGTKQVRRACIKWLRHNYKQQLATNERTNERTRAQVMKTISQFGVYVEHVEVELGEGGKRRGGGGI